MALSEDVVVVFDPGARVMDIDPETLRTVLGRVDWLLCNEGEAHLLGTTGTTLEMAKALLERTGRSGIVVRDGEAGCVVAPRGSEPQRVDGYRVDVVDTNGAGDIHDGVFVSEVARGTSVVEAARRANAAAAMSIGKFGPATCPARDEVTRWYQEFT
jgi:sugar/nucleoside kinase (ribokinase family)